MLPGKRDLYRCCKARRSTSHVNKEFWQQFQNYAPPSLRVIRTKFARTIIGERSEPLSMVFNDQPRDIYIISYFTSKSGIWLVISRVASYFHEPEASANTAYE